MLSALADLRAALRARGSDLLVRVGRPEDVLPRLAAAAGAARVFCHAEAAADERAVEAAVARALDARGAALEALPGGSALFHPDDLPFGPRAAPLAYGDFRDAVAGRGGRGGGLVKRRGAGTPVRRPLPAPDALKGLPVGQAFEPGELPTLRSLGFSEESLRRARADAGAAAAGLRGGESHAHESMQEFARELQRHGADARGRAQPAFAARVSPWLAIGALSPRTLYHALREQLGGGANSGHAAAAPRRGVARSEAGAAGSGGGAGGALSWLLFELMWRDFFRYATLRASLDVPAATNGADVAAVQEPKGAFAPAAAYAMA